MQLITRPHSHWYARLLGAGVVFASAACGTDGAGATTTGNDVFEDGSGGDAIDPGGDIETPDTSPPDVEDVNATDGPDADGSDGPDVDGSDATDGPDTDGSDTPDTDGSEEPDTDGTDVPDTDGSDLSDTDEPDTDSADGPDADDSDTDGGPDATDGIDGAPCDIWCEGMAATCGETPWAFPDAETCADACSTLSADGLTCRTAALSAGTDACADAAVTSAPCGACDGVCGVILAACPSSYDSIEQCTSACESWPDDGAASDLSGDSLQCRLNQAFAAFGGADACAATTADGGGICTTAVFAPTCEGYCALLTSACEGPAAAFPTEGACVSWCTSFIDPSESTAGDTLGCRYAQATSAQSAKLSGADTSSACAAAGPLGGGVCGDACAITCEVTESVCPDAWADVGACLSSCAGLPIGEPSGDTLSCRFAGLVAGDGEGCAAAAGDGPCAASGQLPTCATYCAAVSAACTGLHAQYDSEAACLTFCGAATLVPGQATDATSNTLGCRLGAALKAASDPAAWCGVAGPSGGGQCGTSCGVYCQLATALCGGGGGADALFPGQSACQASCAIIPTTGDGDTLGCRVRALVEVTSGSGACAAAGPESDTCVDTVPSCDHTCHRLQTTCVGGDAQYADKAACLSACDALEPGSIGASEGNSVACRYESVRSAALAVTALDRKAACNAAGLTGGGVCGSWCDVYCPLAETACPTLYSGVDCAATCAGFSDFGSPGDVDGDSVQCRITWLGAALDTLSPGSTPTECAYAGASGGGVCGDADVPGDGCAAPIAVALPTLLTGDTPSATGDFDAESCESGGGTGSPDLVYSFTAPQTGTVVATVDAEFDSVLYARSSCAETACLDHDDRVGPGVESLTFDVVDGETYVVVVDGFAGDAGPFVIEFAMKDAAGPGERCEGPLPGPAIGENISGSTSDHEDDHAVDDCGLGYTAGEGSADLVYAFTAPVAGTYTVALEASYDSVLYILSECSICIGADDAIGPGVESVTLTLDAAESIAIVVDGYEDSGSFSLSISSP